MDRPTPEIVNSPALSHTELIANQPEHRSFVDEMLHSAAYSGLQAPVSGLTQLLDKGLNTSLESSTRFMEAPQPSEFLSSRWHAQQIGGAAGMVVPFLLLHKGVSGAGAAAFGRAETINLTTQSLGRRVVAEAAVTGAVYEGIFRPTDNLESNFAFARMRNALAGGATFATLAAAATGLKGLARAERGTVGTILRSDIGASIAAGLPAGLVSAEAHSLLAGKGHATGGEIAESMYGFALAGGALSTGKMVFGRSQAERSLNQQQRLDSGQARAQGAPTLAERASASIETARANLTALADQVAAPGLRPAFVGVEASGSGQFRPDNAMFMSRGKQLRGGLGEGKPLIPEDLLRRPTETGPQASVESGKAVAETKPNQATITEPGAPEATPEGRVSQVAQTAESAPTESVPSARPAPVERQASSQAPAGESTATARPAPDAKPVPAPQEVRPPSPKPEAPQEVRPPSPKPEAPQEVRPPSPKPEAPQEVRPPSPKPEAPQEVQPPSPKPEAPQEVQPPSPKPEVSQEVRPPSPKPEVSQEKPPEAKPITARQALDRANDAYSDAVEAVREQNERAQLTRRVREAENKLRELEQQEEPKGLDPAALSEHHAKQLQEFQRLQRELDQARNAYRREFEGKWVNPDRPLRAVAEAVQTANQAVAAETSPVRKRALAKEAGIELEKLLARIPEGYKGAQGQPDLPRFSELPSRDPAKLDPVLRLQQIENHLQQKIAEIDAAELSRRQEAARHREAQAAAVLENPVVKDLMQRAASGKVHPHPDAIVVFMSGDAAVQFSGPRGRHAGFTLSELQDPALLQSRLAGKDVSGAVVFMPNKQRLQNGRVVTNMKLSRVYGTTPRGLGAPSLREFLQRFGEQN